jgi:hypothetical protein
MNMDVSVLAPSLTAFLDAGGDPNAVGVDVWRFFRDELVDALLVDPDERTIRYQDAADYRYAAARVADGRAPLPDFDPESGCRWESTPQFALVMAWRADVAEHPELASRLRSFLTADDEQELAGRLDHARRPHPLAIGRAGRDWRCESCGEAFPAGSACLHIDHQPTASAIAAGPWCTTCIKTAYGALLRLSASQRPSETRPGRQWPVPVPH